MKLADLQRVAPDGASILVSFNQPGAVGPHWVELEELFVPAMDYPEFLSRLHVLRHKGNDRAWRIRVTSHGRPENSSVTEHEWPAVAPTEIVAAAFISEAETSSVAKEIIVEFGGVRHDIPLRDDVIDALYKLELILNNDPEVKGDHGLEVSLDEIAEMLLASLVRAMNHAKIGHSDWARNTPISLCTESAMPLRYVAQLFIDACERIGIR